VIHLDTSFFIRALVPGSVEDRALRRWLKQGEVLAMCTIAWAELLCGPLSAAHRELAARVVTERRSFSEHDAEVAARLFNAAGRRRGRLADCMIAAAALDADAPLATSNPGDFEKLVPFGLEIRTE
jgi:predicted nucleic acid-binding protein